MNRIALLICAFFAYIGQGQPSNAQTVKPSFVAVLSVPMATKTNKTGDHIFLRTNLLSDGEEKPITVVEAALVESQTGVRNRILRIQIGRGVDEDDHEFALTARIVAVVSPSNVTQRSEPPIIWMDHFPVSSSGDERQPGERTLSEDPHHVSLLDSLSNFPSSHTVACSKKVANVKQPATDKCMDLLSARGSFGFQGVRVEAGAVPTDSVLRSKKEMSFPPGTLLVLELSSISRTR